MNLDCWLLNAGRAGLAKRQCALEVDIRPMPDEVGGDHIAGRGPQASRRKCLFRRRTTSCRSHSLSQCPVRVFSQPASHNFSGAKAFKEVVQFRSAAVISSWACFYGVAVLLGRAGKMKILGKVLAAPAAPEASEPASSSLTDGARVGCQRPIPLGSAYCPHCGRPQPS